MAGGTIGFYGGGGGEGGGLVSLAPVSTASGTAHDATTAIPDDAMLVRVIVDEVNTNTGNRLVLNLGTSSGYTGQPAGARMVLESSNVSTARTKVIDLYRVSNTSNEWIARGDYEGQVTLTAPLKRIQLTLNTISGNTNTFSGGQVAVMYSSVTGVGAVTSTADLPEGSSGPYYFTDARARGAVSADSASFLRYNSTTGVFSVDGTAFNTAADARIAAASIGDLSDVTGTPATGDILVRGTNSYGPAGIETLVKFAEGSNVTISTAVSAAGVLTATIAATGGGGGGISTISAASDTDFASLQEGDIPVYNSNAGKWENFGITDVVEVSNSGANVTLGTATSGGVLTLSANIGTRALSLSTISGGGATSGHVLTVSTDGNTISAAAAPGQGGGATLADFDSIADSTIVDKANDGVLMYDGNALARMDLERFEEEVEPLELKTLALTGYTYKNASLPSGAGAWTISTIASVKYAIFNGKNSDETRQLSKIMTPNFKVRVQGSSATRWFEFVVTAAAATQGGSILGAISDDYIDSSAANQGVPFSAEESCTVTSNGRHLSYGDLEHSVDSTRRTQAVSAYGLGRFTAAQIAAAKATAQQVAEGDDTKFITAAQARRVVESVDDGSEWSGFTYVSGTPSSGQFGITGTNSGGWVFTFATTDANATQMDDTFGENSEFRVVKDATNKIEGETQYAWRDGNSVSMKLKPNATETGDIRSGSVTLHGTGGLYEDLKNQGFLENTDLVEGTNITLTTSGNQVTISATGGGGGGNVTFATQGTANAGTSTNTVMSPATTRGLVASEAEVIAGTNTYKTLTPQTAHALVDHLAHVATYNGFQNASSPNDLALGRWHINSTGTIAYFRGHTAAEFAAMQREFLVDRYFILRNSTGQRIEAKFSAVQVNDVSGSDIDILQCTIGDHSATPANPTLTGDWSLSILPEQNEQILENAPAKSIPLLALATQPGGQMRTLSADGNSDIGLTTFGDVSDTVWNSITATNSNLLPVPHPNTASTPSGTGEVTFTPRSASSSFATAINIGFGWLGDHNVKVHFLLARKIANGSWTVVDGSKKFNVLNGNYGAVDFNVTPIAFDTPNTTEQVTYRWMIVRGDVSGGGNNGRVYPIAQSAIFIEIPNM